MDKLSGLLPWPGTKEIARGRGVMSVLGIPLVVFRVRGTELRYRGIPWRDELVPVGENLWHGIGLFAGVQFCRFRLSRRPLPLGEPSVDYNGATKRELYAEAQRLRLPGRSKMSKAELLDAVRSGPDRLSHDGRAAPDSDGSP